MTIFNLSLHKRYFLEELKIARVTPIFKVDDVNCRPMSVLPCFPKILEWIMHYRLFKYLTKNELLYKKQFWFKKLESTVHEII